jgi:hypothetical protein
MVLTIVGWTIGQATCLRSKQEGFAFGQSSFGKYISGELAHMHSMRKLMASCDIMSLCLTHPINRNETHSGEMDRGGYCCRLSRTG